METSQGYIKINSDNREDVGTIYKVLEYFRRNPNSTAVQLTLEYPNGKQVRRVVPYHYIEWLEDGEY